MRSVSRATKTLIERLLQLCGFVTHAPKAQNLTAAFDDAIAEVQKVHATAVRDAIATKTAIKSLADDLAAAEEVAKKAKGALGL